MQDKLFWNENKNNIIFVTYLLSKYWASNVLVTIVEADVK